MLNLFGPINDLGMGVHCFNMAKALEALGQKICLLPPFGQVQRDAEPVRTWLARRAKFSPLDPSLMIFDVPFFPHFAGRPKIGFAVFETDGFTPIQTAAVNSLDLVLVPSEWGRSVLIRNGLSNGLVRVVPEGFDPEIFTLPNERTVPKGPIRFIHVGKFEERKGTLQAVRCFARALEREEAELIMHIHNPFLSDYSPVERLMKELGFITHDGSAWRRLGLKVEFTKPVDDPREMARMYREADCGIFPSKGEAWGLPVLECLVSGTPVIAGRWTGMAEYLLEDYPEELVLMESEREPANDGVWYHGDRGMWHEPNSLELEARIRWAYVHARGMAANDAGWSAFVDETRKHFTWENAAKRFLEVLREHGSL